MPLTLLYHDVVDEGQDDNSGFPGAGAARYKLTRTAFRDHLDAIAAALREPPVTVDDSWLPPASLLPLFITFDDGGASALSPIADLLEGHGWRGHFFVTASYIDTPTFLSAAQIRALRDRGHIIGTHSWSHPQRMSSCGWDELLGEWQKSREVLAAVLGEPVTVGSVPGGFYSQAVARAAARAGLRILFTSEPTTRSWVVDGCLVLGRYTVYRGMSAAAAASLVSGGAIARGRQALSWNLKKVAKAIGGPMYLALRERILKRAYPQR